MVLRAEAHAEESSQDDVSVRAFAAARTKTQPWMLVLGHESRGIPDALRSLGRPVTLPVRNLSVPPD